MENRRKGMKLLLLVVEFLLKAYNIIVNKSRRVSGLVLSRQRRGEGGQGHSALSGPGWLKGGLEVVAGKEGGLGVLEVIDLRLFRDPLV